MQEGAAGKQKRGGCWSKAGGRPCGEEGEAGAEKGAWRLCLVFEELEVRSEETGRKPVKANKDRRAI